jgi:hypothetical protein
VAPAFAGSRFAEPRRFDPATDGDLVQVAVGGRVGAAWTYRNGAETDIAVAFLDQRGRWSEPLLIGQDDGVDQERPALEVDANGSLYLAFAERETGLVKLSALAFGAPHWTPAVAVSAAGESARLPELKIVGDRVVLGYVTESGVRIRSFFRIGPSTSNMSDGPDPNFGNDAPFPNENEGNEGPTTLDNPDDHVDIDANQLSKPTRN